MSHYSKTIKNKMSNAQFRKLKGFFFNLTDEKVATFLEYDNQFLKITSLKDGDKDCLAITYQNPKTPKNFDLLLSVNEDGDMTFYNLEDELILPLMNFVSDRFKSIITTQTPQFVNRRPKIK